MSTVNLDGSEPGTTPLDSETDATAERIPLGRLLVDAGILSPSRLEDVLREGSETGERLGEVVVRWQLASEDDVARLLADQWGLTYVERASIWFDADALARLSREDAQRLEALPTRIEDGRVVVAVAEPTDQRLAALRNVVGEDAVVVVVPKTALEAGLRSELLTSGPSRLHAPPISEEPSPGRAAPVAADEGFDPRPFVAPSPLSAPTQPVTLDSGASSYPADVPSVMTPNGSTTTALAESLAELIEANLSTRRAADATESGDLAMVERRVELLEGEAHDLRALLTELGDHFRVISGLLERR